MKITQWPLADRPREKLFRQGSQALTDAELIAIVLQVGIKGKTALDVARELLHRFGGLQKLAQLKPQQLSQLPGLGPAKAAMLRAALELGKRSASTTVAVGEKLASSQASRRFLENRLQGEEREVFLCIFMNNHNHILALEELFHGSLTEATVYPREVVKSALAHNAAKLILAHNHPSGNPAPSAADQTLTRHLKQALGLVDIEVLDHIIVGQQTSFSFAEVGLL